MRPWNLMFLKLMICVYLQVVKRMKLGKSFGVVIKIVEGRDVLSKGIEQNHNFFMKKDEIFYLIKIVMGKTIHNL
jgi:hypothetical protein